MKDCIPQDKKKNWVNSSRIFVLLWLSTIIISITLGSFLPIFLLLFPKFFKLNKTKIIKESSKLYEFGILTGI